MGLPPAAWGNWWPMRATRCWFWARMRPAGRDLVEGQGACLTSPEAARRWSVCACGACGAVRPPQRSLHGGTGHAPERLREPPGGRLRDALRSPLFCHGARRASCDASPRTVARLHPQRRCSLERSPHARRSGRGVRAPSGTHTCASPRTGSRWPAPRQPRRATGPATLKSLTKRTRPQDSVLPAGPD
jgi:hypothetical protein